MRRLKGSTGLDLGMQLNRFLATHAEHREVQTESSSSVAEYRKGQVICWQTWVGLTLMCGVPPSPSSALADVQLAEVAEQVCKIVEHPKSNHPYPGSPADTPQCSVYSLEHHKFSLNWGEAFNIFLLLLPTSLHA